MNRKKNHVISGSARTVRASTDRNPFEGEDSDPVPAPDDEEPPGRGSHLQNRETSNEIFPFLSRRSSAFRNRYYPDTGDDEWNDWRWRFGHRIHTLKDHASLIDPFDPDYIQEVVNGKLTLKNYEEKLYEYPDDSLSFDNL